MGKKLQLLRKVSYFIHTISILVGFAIASAQSQALPIEFYAIMNAVSAVLHTVAFFCDKLQEHYNALTERLSVISETMSQPISVDIQSLQHQPNNEPVEEPIDQPAQQTDRSMATARVLIDRKTGEIIDYLGGLTPRIN